MEIPTQNYYFDFDEAIYYSGTDSITNQIFDRDSQPNKSFKDSIVNEIVSDFHHQAADDKNVLRYIDNMGFSETVIPKSKHAELKEIFRERDYTMNLESTTCEPIFRDIFVLKKKGKVTGMAKICYDCGMHRILGTKANTDGFGESGEYGKLLKLMRK